MPEQSMFCSDDARKDFPMLQTTHYTIRSRLLPASFDGFCIAHLSDLHGALHGKNNRRLIQAVRRANPDMVVMTGDMADHTHDSIPRLIRLCRRLRAWYPVYFILGNHEQTLPPGALSGLISALKELGVTILDNSHCSLIRGSASISLYGLVTPMVYYKDPLGEYVRGIHFSAQDTEALLGKGHPGTFQILLAHNPLYYPSYRDWGASLVLSGHIHGGIIRIPKLGGLLSPDLTLFPKYDAGHFHEADSHLIVSRGLGNHFLFRVCNPPEVAVVRLTSLKR